MAKKKEKKPGAHYYGKEGYSKAFLIFLKPRTRSKLMRLAEEKGKTLQELIRETLEKKVN